jgi:molecular chaperone GrpE
MSEQEHGETQAESKVHQEQTSVEATDTRFERKWTKRSSAQSPPYVAEQTVSPLTGEAELRAELEKQKQRADELSDRLQRALADLANYRKRAEFEREEMVKFANMMLVAELLSVLDNFERALQTIPKSLQQFTWLQGIMLIERQLRAILEHQGLQPIEAVGQPFNAALHEAIVEEVTTEYAAGTVVAELQRGYTMHGRVLRPTLAKVARAPEEPKEADSSGEVQAASSPVEAASEQTETENVEA